MSKLLVVRIYARDRLVICWNYARFAKHMLQHTLDLRQPYAGYGLQASKDKSLTEDTS